MNTGDKFNGTAGTGLELSCERADALSKGQLQNLPVSVLLMASAAGISYDGRVPMHAVGWLSVMLVMNGIRYVLAKSYQTRDKRTGRGARIFLGWALVGGALNGLGYAVIPAAFLSADAGNAVPLILILTGVTSGVVVQGAAYKPSSIVMNVPIILTTAFKMLELNNSFHLMMCFDVLLYLLFLLVTASRLENSFIARLNITVQALQLAASVEKEHDAVQAAAASLYQLANHDSLTGLANRAAFSQALDVWLENAATDQSCFLLCLLDLDEFKSVNDTLGHGAGDHVLTEVARRLPGFFEARMSPRGSGETSLP